MSAITGNWNKCDNIDKALFESMHNTLLHRGKNDFFSYFFKNDNIAIACSQLIKQENTKYFGLNKMNEKIYLISDSKIYNYTDIRQQLEAKNYIFQSNTDNELLLYAFIEWNTDMFCKIEGGFAIAIINETTKQILLARDKFGIKPLYYYLNNAQFVFASEIKAIIQDKNIKRAINYSSMCDFFVYRYVPSPNTIYNNIFKVKPSCYLIIDKNFEIKEEEYWQLKTDNISSKRQTIVKEIDTMIRNNVYNLLANNNDIYSFLSGGYDSSLIVKYIADYRKNINTFSVGFENWEHSEHKYASIVSKKFHTSHNSIILSSDSLDIIDDIMYYYDDPIADISIIPSFFLSQYSSKYNQLFFSGDGADELFAGYSWHKKYLWNISKEQIKDAKKWKWKLPINHYDISSYQKAMEMGSFDSLELQTLLTTNLHQYIRNDSHYFYKQYYNDSHIRPKHFQILDIKCFMSELVLTKMDRASMANSIELLLPFLNSQLYDKILQLNPKVYFDEKQQKVILYKILKHQLPRQILNRSKQGFTGPDNYYMNIEWYKSKLHNSELVKNNIINQHAIDKYIQDKEHWKLWKILVFEKWYKKWI